MFLPLADTGLAEGMPIEIAVKAIVAHANIFARSDQGFLLLTTTCLLAFLWVLLTP
jgi:hypothetical protein